eukprot:3753683-Rhodomonas_salina.3
MEWRRGWGLPESHREIGAAVTCSKSFVLPYATFPTSILYCPVLRTEKSVSKFPSLLREGNGSDPERVVKAGR